MAEYHVGCGAFAIYAGTVKANGKEWKDKTRVTDEAVEAVRDWLVSKAEEEKTRILWLRLGYQRRKDCDLESDY